MGAALTAFARKKDLTSPAFQENRLPRNLNVVDLTFLGIGSTLGGGVYVVTGEIAKNTAGPAAILSFCLAAFASLLCALCYAEFATRVPKAGSAYIYSYVTMGELCAFMIGWNLLLEYLIGAAAVARAWSSYFNSLVENAVRHELQTHVAHMHSSGISSHPDLFAFALCVLIALLVAFGPKGGTAFNSLLTFINLVIILFVSILGWWFGHASNWKGSFMPFGFSGVLKGSATAFFAFVGFDVIAIAGEEAKSPAKSMPKAILLSIGVSLLGYCCIASALTTLQHYTELSDDASLPEAFNKHGAKWAKYVIASGAIAGLTSSLVGPLFPATRLFFAMSADGLMLKPFSWVNESTKTPVFSALVSGGISGFLAMIFDLTALVEMVSIGTLQAYMIVAICVLVLRYQERHVGLRETDDGLVHVTDESIVDARQGKIEQTPSQRSGRLVIASTVILIINMFAFAFTIIRGGTYIAHGYFWAVALFFNFLGITVVAVTVMVLQPQNKNELPFKAPLVPILPLLSIFINIYLMLELSILTWVRFGLWMFLGKFIGMD